MIPQELYDRFRTDIVDVAVPQLWTEDEVWGYMDAAHKKFVRLMGGISDSSSSMTELDVAVGDKWIDIDPRILKIRHAQKTTNDAELQIVNFEDTELLNRDNDYGVRRVFKLNNDTGPLQYLVVGMERYKVRCVPIPDTAETVYLIVYRLPLETISSTSNTSEFEIEEFHHEYLLLWMKHLAYLKQDAETFDKSKSDEMGAKFLAYCAEAKHERELREHKYRAVVYGGL